jgi:hypothetical protein
MKTVLSIATLLLAFTFATSAQTSDVKKKLNGTWKIEAPDAPYDYQEGEIVFYKEDGKDKIKIVTTYDVIMAKNLKVKDNKVTFEFEVEYELCTAKMEYKDNKMTGIVETVEGNLPVTATKKK